MLKAQSSFMSTLTFTKPLGGLSEAHATFLPLWGPSVVSGNPNFISAPLPDLEKTIILMLPH